VLPLADEHSHALNDDAELVNDPKEERKPEEQTQPRSDQGMIGG
jgi:hypothetical protein